MKKTNSQYQGLLANMPGVLPSGSTYFAVDEVKMYLFGENGLPKAIQGSGGGGGVMSVTGSGVNNSDPTNPMISTPSLQEVLTSGSIETTGKEITFSNAMNPQKVKIKNTSMTSQDADSMVEQNADEIAFYNLVSPTLYKKNSVLKGNTSTNPSGSLNTFRLPNVNPTVDGEYELMIKEEANKFKSTSVISGGLTINSNTSKFDIDVVCEFIDPVTFVPTKRTVTQLGVVATGIAAQMESFITINKLGAIVQSTVQPDPLTYNDVAGVWVLIHNDLATITSILSFPMYADVLSTQVHQMLEFDGFRKKSGTNTVFAGTTGTRLSHTGGLAIRNGGGGSSKSPVFDLASGIDSTFKINNRVDSNPLSGQNLDTANIDLANVTTALANNRFAAHKIWKFADGSIRQQRGQTEYVDLATARGALGVDPYVDSPYGRRNGIHIGWVIAKKNTTWATGVQGVDYSFEDVRIGSNSNVATPTLQNVYTASAMPIIVVKRESDFPPIVTGNITLADNTVYQISGNVIMTSTITLGASNVITGSDKDSDKLFYTGASTFLIGVNRDFSLNTISISSSNALSSVYNLTGSTNKVEIRDTIHTSCNSLGTINGVDVLSISRSLITGCTNGLIINGISNYVDLFNNLWISNLATITNISIPSGTFKQLRLSRQDMDLAVSQTGILVGTPTIANGTISNCEFVGAGIGLAGVSNVTPNWMITDCNGTSNSVTSQPIASDRSYVAIRATNGTRVSTGILTNGYGTVSNTTDSTTTFTKYATAATIGDMAGIESVSFNEFPINSNPIYSAIIKTSGDLTAQSIWCALIQTTLNNLDNQPNQNIGFRYSTVAGDTGWRGIVDNGTQTVSANIGTLATNTLYKLEFKVDFAASKTYFRVNSGAWTTVSAVPLNGTILGMCTEIIATTASARSFDFSRLDISHT